MTVTYVVVFCDELDCWEIELSFRKRTLEESVKLIPPELRLELMVELLPCLRLLLGVVVASSLAFRFDLFKARELVPS